MARLPRGWTLTDWKLSDDGKNAVAKLHLTPLAWAWLFVRSILTGRIRVRVSRG